MFKHLLKACLPLVALTAILFNSCNKDELPPAQTPAPTTVYYTRFKIDGVEKVYLNTDNTCRFNWFVPANNQYNTGISCYLSSSDLDHNGVGLSLSDSATLALDRTYVNFATVLSTEYELDFGAITYTDENGVTTSNLSLSPLPNLRVILTEQTSTTLKGRFSATLYNPTNNIAVHELTDGEFYLPIFQ